MLVTINFCKFEHPDRENKEVAQEGKGVCYEWLQTGNCDRNNCGFVHANPSGRGRGVINNGGGMAGRGEMVGRGGMGRGMGRGRGGWGMEQMVGSTSTQRQQNEVGEKRETREGENLECKVEERGWWWKYPNKENEGDMGSENTPEALGGEIGWEDTTFDGITGAIGGRGKPGKGSGKECRGKGRGKDQEG